MLHVALAGSVDIHTYIDAFKGRGSRAYWLPILPPRLAIQWNWMHTVDFYFVKLIKGKPKWIFYSIPTIYWQKSATWKHSLYHSSFIYIRLRFFSITWTALMKELHKVNIKFGIPSSDWRQELLKREQFMVLYNHTKQLSVTTWYSIKMKKNLSKHKSETIKVKYN